MISTTQPLKNLKLRDSDHEVSGHHLTPAPAQYRARSPSPLDAPNHHHLIMETTRSPKMSHINNNNNNSENDVIQRQNSAPHQQIPTLCSSQLAKVLEKQIEVNILLHFTTFMKFPADVFNFFMKKKSKFVLVNAPFFARYKSFFV